MSIERVKCLWGCRGVGSRASSRSGVEASFAELYRGKRVILTPTPGTAADALQRVRAMWEATGAVVKEMEVRHHDEVLRDDCRQRMTCRFHVIEVT